MKTSTASGSKITVDNRLLKEIENQVAETLAMDIELMPVPFKRKFTSADLWNIHRNRKRLSRSA